MAGQAVEKTLFALGQNARANFLTTLKTVDESSTVVKIRVDAALLRSGHEIFLQWATDVRLFREDHISLDYYFRVNEDGGSCIRSQLTRLIRGLKGITSIAMRESAVEKPSETSEPDRLYAELVEDGSCSSDDDEDIYTLTFHFDEVIAAIDNLRCLRFNVDVGQSAGISRWITDQLTYATQTLSNLFGLHDSTDRGQYGSGDASKLERSDEESGKLVNSTRYDYRMLPPYKASDA